MRVRTYRVPPGGRVDCTIRPDDDVIVGAMQADLDGVTRVDVITETDAGTRRIEDVPFAPGAGEILVAQSSPYLRSLGHTVQRFRLVASHEGGDRLLGEYTFDHHPTAG
jgi:hypothetical protein